MQEHKNVVLYDPLKYENSSKIHQPMSRGHFSKTATQFRLKRSQNQLLLKEQNIYFPGPQAEPMEKPRTQQSNYKKNYIVQSQQYKTQSMGGQQTQFQDLQLNQFDSYEPQQNEQFKSKTSQNFYQQQQNGNNSHQQSQQFQNIKSTTPFNSTNNNGFKRNYSTKLQPQQSKTAGNFFQKNVQGQSEEDEMDIVLSWKNMKQYCKEQIENPKLFYSIGNLGFQNYKYPRLPVIKDRLEKYTKKQKHNTNQFSPKAQANNIEDICISKYRPDDYEDIKYNHLSQQAKLQVQNTNGENIQNRVQIDVIQDRISENMGNLESKIKQKQIAKPPVVRKEKKCNKLDKNTKFYVMERDLNKNIQITNNIFLNNLKQNDHNKIDNKQNKSTRFNNSRGLDNQLNNVEIGEEFVNKTNQYPRVPGSKAKKINDSIETYNKLVKISNQIITTQYNDLITQVQQQDTSSKQQQQLQQLSLKNRVENVLLLSVFVDNFSVLKENKRAITQRILLVLDLNPNDDFYQVPLDKFMKFNNILIHRTASLKEIANFIETFFKLDDEQIGVQDFKSILRTLTLSVDQKHKDVSKSLFEFMIEHFVQNQVIIQGNEYIHSEKFVDSLLLNKENTLDILDLICGMH